MDEFLRSKRGSCQVPEHFTLRCTGIRGRQIRDLALARREQVLEKVIRGRSGERRNLREREISVASRTTTTTTILMTAATGEKGEERRIANPRPADAQQTWVNRRADDPPSVRPASAAERTRRLAPRREESERAREKEMEGERDDAVRIWRRTRAGTGMTAARAVTRAEREREKETDRQTQTHIHHTAPPYTVHSYSA